MKPISESEKKNVIAGAPECFFAPFLWAIYASTTATSPLRASTGAVINACWSDTSDE